MVSASPERLKQEAEQLFRAAPVPASLRFFDDLTPLHQRLFLVELWDALSAATIRAKATDLADLVELVEGWEATAELDRAPEVVTEINRTRDFRTLEIERLGGQ